MGESRSGVEMGRECLGEEARTARKEEGLNRFRAIQGAETEEPGMTKPWSPRETVQVDFERRVNCIGRT